MKNKKIKNVMTLENLIVFLDQKPRVDLIERKAYFACPYCREDALEELKGVLCKKGFKNVENSNVEFGTLCFNLENQSISCCSRPNENYEDEHAIALEEELQKRFLPQVTYVEYLNQMFEQKSKRGKNE